MAHVAKQLTPHCEIVVAYEPVESATAMELATKEPVRAASHGPTHACDHFAGLLTRPVAGSAGLTFRPSIRAEDTASGRGAGLTFRPMTPDPCGGRAR